MVPMHVALIEQDRMVVQLVSQYLLEAGHTLNEMGPNLKALEETMHDLVICDFQAQTSEGCLFYAELRAHPSLSGLPCLLIAPRVTAQDVQLVRKDPLSSLLIKPFTRTVFDDALHRCLKQSLIRNIPSPNIPPSSTSAVDIVFDWREDMEAIQKLHQRIRGQLVIDPQSLYQSKIKEHPDTDKKALRQQLINLILLKSVTLIERDTATQQLLLDHCRKNNVLEVETFADGLEALDHLKAKGSSLVIMDWHPEGLSGLALYNRIRESDVLQKTPILIVANDTETAKVEALLVEDLHVGILTKPLQPKKLQETILVLMAASISADDIDGALYHALGRATSPRLLHDLVHDFCERLPSMKLHLINFLQTLLRKQRLAEAEQFGLILLERQEFSIPAATVLAKIYHLKQRPDAAANILRYITALAPHRLDRLLLAAEEELCLFRPKRAENYIVQAAKIDADHVRVKAAAFLADIVAKHQAGQVKEGAAPLKNLASVLNTVGVTLAQSGQAGDAERYYTSALLFVVDRMDQARLTYNLALCYLRLGDKDKAQQFFFEADRLADGQLPKAQSHLQKLGEQNES